MNATAAAIFALTFVSEDAAVLSAAALAAGGLLDGPVAFAACFFGIWLGDIWLYGMARGFGAPFLDRFEGHAAIARSASWFERRGALVLLAVRFVPGLRLPTYLAAGAIRFPLGLFVCLTAVAAAVWVGGILWLGRFEEVRNYTPLIVLGAVAVAMLPRKRGGPPRLNAKGAGRPLSRRVLEFEFWPAWVFYTPVALFYIWLGLRYRGWNLPAAANPCMPAGGLVGESKFDTLRLLSLVAPEFTAGTWLLAPGDPKARFATLLETCARSGIQLPFILKPDVGQRGAGVKLIRSLEAAAVYLAQVSSAVLLQRYAPGPLEAGVFYYRLPDEPRGRILAITEKIFPMIEGDGRSTIEEIVLADVRAAKISSTYFRRFAHRRTQVLARGEKLRLVETGNHIQGCIFRDGMRLATPELLKAIDTLSQALPDFFIGRYDLRYESEDDLRAGRNFTIVELNGAGSEATSIYDERTSLREAYGMLWRQWELVFRIGAANRARGWRGESTSELLRAWRRTNLMTESYPMAD